MVMMVEASTVKMAAEAMVWRRAIATSRYGSHSSRIFFLATQFL
jgi:hypothetical protein